MNRLGSTLLRMGLFLLPVSLGHSAESLGDGQGVAPVSASDGVVISAISVIAMHAVGSGAPQRALDLRLPDPQSLSIQDPQQPVTSSESDEVNATTVVATRLLFGHSADTQPSLAGISSLYWAVHHPAQASRVLLPILPDGDETDGETRGRAPEPTTAEMLTRQRDVSVKPAPTVLARASGSNVSAARIPGPTHAAASPGWAPRADASCVRYLRAFPREKNEIHWARSECTEGSVASSAWRRSARVGATPRSLTESASLVRRGAMTPSQGSNRCSSVQAVANGSGGVIALLPTSHRLSLAR